MFGGSVAVLIPLCGVHRAIVSTAIAFSYSPQVLPLAGEMIVTVGGVFAHSEVSPDSKPDRKIRAEKIRATILILLAPPG